MQITTFSIGQNTLVWWQTVLTVKQLCKKDIMFYKKIYTLCSSICKLFLKCVNLKHICRTFCCNKLMGKEEMMKRWMNCFRNTVILNFQISDSFLGNLSVKEFWNTHTHTTILRLCRFCPGQPGWAGTWRKIHPLTLIVVINHPYLLSPSTTNHDILCIQSTCLTVFFQVFFGLPLGLAPSISYSIHFFTQSLSSFRNTCPYHRNLFRCSIVITAKQWMNFENWSIFTEVVTKNHKGVFFLNKVCNLEG